MLFISYARMSKYLSLGVLVSLIAACSSLSEQSTTGSSTNMESGPAPDPYLTQQKSLPGEVRENFKKARNAMQTRNWAQAQTLLENMTQNHPSLSGLHLNLGLVYRAQGQQDAAAGAFAQAIEANPLNSEAYNQLAILRREQGEFAEAEQLYLGALEVWPHNPVVHRNLGILYDLYMGRLTDALRHYQMSEKVEPGSDSRTQGWIADLQRRLTEQQAAVK